MLTSQPLALFGELLAFGVGHCLRMLHRGLIDFVLLFQLLLERCSLLFERLIRLRQFPLAQFQLGEQLLGLLKSLGELLLLLGELFGSQPGFFLGIECSQPERPLLTIKLRKLFVEISFSAFQLGDLSAQVLRNLAGLDEEINLPTRSRRRARQSSQPHFMHVFESDGGHFRVET